MRLNLSIILILAAIISFFIFIKVSDKNHNEIESFSRNFSDTLTIDRDFKMTNLQPYKFYGDEADFWLIDKNNEAVVKYDLINDTIFSTHGVRGQAPFENQRLKNFDFDESGYYLIDNSKEMLKKMSYSDSLIYYYKLDFHMTDGVHLKNNNFRALEY